MNQPTRQQVADIAAEVRELRKVVEEMKSVQERMNELVAPSRGPLLNRD